MKRIFKASPQTMLLSEQLFADSLISGGGGELKFALRAIFEEVFNS